MRSALLDAAQERATAGDWGATRMADVAAAAGVSRQTLYNEFGSKDRLAEELLLRHTQRFLAGVREVLAGHAAEPPAMAVSAAAQYVLGRGADDPLLKAILTAQGDEALLPYLTYRGERGLIESRDVLVDHLHRHCPDVPAADLVALAESVVRLAISHLLLPLAPADTVAHQLGELVGRYLTGGCP